MKSNQDRFADIFRKARARYPELEHAVIDLRFKKGRFFTMKAQMTLVSMLSDKRKYVIDVNPRRKNILSKLSEDDIVGWFGHELAHVIDYEKMSGAKLLLFMLRYLLDLGFRFSLERRINAYAYNHGFAKELFGVWKKFLVMDGVNTRYQNYIIRNYAPLWEDIRDTARREGVTEEVYRSFMRG